MPLRHAPDPVVNAWLLYDDACGLCRRWVPAWRRALQRRNIAIAPLQSDWVSQALPMPASQLLEDILLLTRSGQVLRGADVYRHLMSRVWWLYPLYLLTSLPLVRGLFSRAYRWVADNRYRFSKTCGNRFYRG